MTCRPGSAVLTDDVVRCEMPTLAKNSPRASMGAKRLSRSFASGDALAGDRTLREDEGRCQARRGELEVTR